MESDTKDLRKKLKAAGLSDQAINAAWPTWWSDQAETSKSARADLRFTLARRLGLSPQSLTGDRVDFVWRDKAKFKSLTGEDEAQQAALTSFGMSIGRLLIKANPFEDDYVSGISSAQLRTVLLRGKTFVDLAGLLATCWAIGIPVIHLRVFPLPAKSMHAMVVKIENRFAILLGRDANYPAPIAFALAHEIGHIARHHLIASDAVVDLKDSADSVDRDPEEQDADEFALSLLTGTPNPQIETNIANFTGRALADEVMNAGPREHIEPGTLALCVGYRTGNWAAANAALKYIYAEEKPVWREVNAIAKQQLKWDELGEDGQDYLTTVMADADG